MHVGRANGVPAPGWSRFTCGYAAEARRRAARPRAPGPSCGTGGLGERGRTCSPSAPPGGLGRRSPVGRAMLGAMSSSARPSRTAKKIARLLLLADRVPGIREVLPAQFAADVEPVLRASGAFRSFEIDAMQRPSALHFHAWTERLFGRGHLLWFALRK